MKCDHCGKTVLEVAGMICQESPISFHEWREEE